MSVHRDAPPYKIVGAALLAVAVIVGGGLYLQFRGRFTPAADLTVLSARSGLVVEPGAKVTFHGVQIGRVVQVATVASQSGPRARLSLHVNPDALQSLPANVAAEIHATTVFGNKYVSLRTPHEPARRRLRDGAVIESSSVTTEFNTVFQTVVAIAEKVDPIKLNQTLAAAAQALHGLGDRLGESFLDAIRVLDEATPRLPRLGQDARTVAALADIYTGAAPDLWDALQHALTTARTLTERRTELDAALLAAVGFGSPATDLLTRSGPNLRRTVADLVPTARLLDDYRGMILCTIRNYAQVGPDLARVLGGDNGYSLRSAGTPLGLGAGNAFIYPDNLPRVNAKGGPEGRPGCWQKITRDLWPAPYLVTDTGYSLAPYNHIELGQPLVTDYVWGRQLGENTINP